MARVKVYLLSVAIAFDRQLNAVLAGSCDETLSSRMFRAWADQRRPGRWFKPLVDKFFGLFGQVQHCYTAWKYEAGRFRSDVTLDTAGVPLSETLLKVSNLNPFKESK